VSTKVNDSTSHAQRGNVELEATAGKLGISFLADVLTTPASVQFVQRIPISFARRHGLLGLASNNGHMPIAIADPSRVQALDTVSRHLGVAVTPVLCNAEQIAVAINLAYQQQTGQAERLIENLDKREILAELSQLSQKDDLLDNSGRAPVIKLANLLLFEAVQQGASDIHIHPYEDSLVARLRIDGVLFDAFTLGKGLQDEIISRIKVVGKMNIAEKRLPQDGRATVQVGDRVIDLRIASLPTSFGERIVIRLLDKSARLYNLSNLGLDAETLQRFRELISLEHGLILVTGPTGAGKTTTLYAALQELNVKELNILTLEDPIEYQLPGVSQTQVSEKKGMTFASGLRSVLRQDPDVIMVGEIRDRETAVMAIQSALTGHLVFSTLHTNDAASAVTRLLDLGIEPYLAASSVVGVLAQRLVRHVCPSCAKPARPSVDELRRLEMDESVDTSAFRSGSGCADCRHTGYRGRVGLFELLMVDNLIREKITACSTAAEIKAAAVSHGMQTLREGGIKCVSRGITTSDEVLRVTMRATM
jgi:general secretion pathway protein E